MGCWGESITYDPDMTLGRAQVDDVRPFLVNASGEWQWTGNVGVRASWYTSHPRATVLSHRINWAMRPTAQYTGPNLTNVVYAGVSADGKIEANISTQLEPNDDPGTGLLPP